MHDLTTTGKIRNFVESNLLAELNSWSEQLMSRDLSGVESQLSARLREVYNYTCEQLLGEAAAKLAAPLVEQAREAGALKTQRRPVRFRLSNGHELQLPSPYVTKAAADWPGGKHLLARHWGIRGNGTAGLYEKVGFCSALGPSYALAHQTLKQFGVEISLSSVQALTNRLATRCQELGEENLMLKPGESLAGKRVLLSLDGGRTRTREYNGRHNEEGNACYDTPWREPKLFVIDVLDAKGRPIRQEVQPIYGCRFGIEDILGLLERYLCKLNIDQAAEVQLIADGAPWIWNQVKPLLLRLGVAEERLKETLDYYHASEYVHQLVEHMPKRISMKQKRSWTRKFKHWLWQGQGAKIITACKEIYKRPNDQIRRTLEYLGRHQHRMQYADNERDGFMRGSGIIESGIRRIINLRFKNASTFWEKARVEKLYFLRAALLTQRWQTVIQNLINLG